MDGRLAVALTTLTLCVTVYLKTLKPHPEEEVCVCACVIVRATTPTLNKNVQSSGKNQQVGGVKETREALEEGMTTNKSWSNHLAEDGV